MPLRLVRQETDYDCGVACIATVLGVTLEEANRLLGRDVGVPHEAMRLYDGPDATGKPEQIGVLGEEMATILFDHGIPAIHMYSRQSYTPWMREAFSELRLYGVDVLERHCYEEGGIAVAGVCSLRYEGRYHWIVIEGRDILDPGRGQRLYMRGDDLTVCQFVLVRRGRSG